MLQKYLTGIVSSSIALPLAFTRIVERRRENSLTLKRWQKYVIFMFQGMLKSQDTFLMILSKPKFRQVYLLKACHDHEEIAKEGHKGHYSKYTAHHIPLTFRPVIAKLCELWLLGYWRIRKIVENPGKANEGDL